MAKDTNADRADNCEPQLFIGRHDSKVYHGGKICIPAEWRSRLDGDRVVAMRDIAEPNAICLMPESLYEMELTTMQDEDYSVGQRNALLIAKQLRLDVRGRIKLPKELLEMFGGNTRVTLVGCVRTIRIYPYQEQPGVDEETLLTELKNALDKRSAMPSTAIPRSHPRHC